MQHQPRPWSCTPYHTPQATTACLCAADGHPLSHMINHREEARKYDPQGNYVRRWLPVLARLPVEYMHRCCPRLSAPFFRWQAQGSSRGSAMVMLLLCLLLTPHLAGRCCSS